MQVGTVGIGSDYPVVVQSMTNCDPADLDRSIPQVKALEQAGCEIIRTSVRDEKQAKALGELIKHMTVPLVADIHFNHRLAILSMEQGASKVRVNPGNIGGEDRFREVLRAAKANCVAVRIGINSGSLEKDLLEKYSHPCPEAFVESALRALDVCESENFDRVVLSLKSSSVRDTVESNRMLAQKCDVPIHLGVTEAGDAKYGALKSAAGLSPLLLEGIGDTIRVSLTGDPVAEIPVAYDILKATGVRITSPEIVSCPTCGRIRIELEPIVEFLKEELKGVTAPLRISVLGCPVNGPGEAAESHIGVTGGNGRALIYRDGKVVKNVPENQMREALSGEVKDWLEKNREKSQG